jgi:molybdate transport repressor ModE-like protein
MKLVPKLGWAIAGSPPRPLAAQLVPLLAAIAATGSLAQAVVRCAISYRSGWGLLREAERMLGADLVRLERGRGASLAPAGRRLLAATAAGERRLARVALDLGAAAARESRRRVPHLRVAASHDLALAALRDAIDARTLELELDFVGSLVALEAFAAGRVDAAGFHVPLGERDRDAVAPFVRFLSSRRDRLLRFVDREQGLILARDRSSQVNSLADVAARGLRFVNRQRGSGTRLLIDRRLAQEGVAPGQLAGYANEEHTHAAVAATIASGGADAGFGLRAAAAEHRLAFVPLVRERYFFAVRASALALPPVARFVELLRGPLTAGIAARLPGYHAADAGAVAGVDLLARKPRRRGATPA